MARKATKESGRPQVDVPQYEPDLGRALERSMQLMRIPGRSCHEGAVAQFIRDRLVVAGVPNEAIVHDDANNRSPAGGEIGNLIVRLPGTVRAPRRLLMAHLDTVPICEGCDPIRNGEFIESANPKTGLGADNRSGVGVVLTTALEILERKLPHPPLTLFFPIQEELGLYGSRFVRKSLLGKPQLAWNWDGRGPHRITLAAIGGNTLDVKVHGIASHAGGAPECGVSAVAIAGLAIHELVTGGWHGEVRKGRSQGTCNLAIVRGGDAVNTVTDFVHIQGECRGYDRRFRERIVAAVEQAFSRAAAAVRNDENKPGRAEVTSEVEYEAFQLDKTAACVQAADAAIRAIGLEPELITQNSALDANWMNYHGIPTANLGAGQACVHTTDEAMDIEDYERACRVALRLATV